MKIARKRSALLAEWSGAKDKECWSNALKAMTFLDIRARYVEGWAVTDLGLLVEHGWVELDGWILDTTPAYHKRERRCRYFPGVRYTLAEAMDHDGQMLPLAKLHVPEYRKAYGLAHVAAYGCTPEELRAKLDRIKDI